MISFSLFRALSLKLRAILVVGGIAAIVRATAFGTTRFSTAAGTRPSPPLPRRTGEQSMRLVRLAPIGALALTMAACGTLRPASVVGGECRVFERPDYVVRGQTRYDQNWNRFQHRGRRGCVRVAAAEATVASAGATRRDQASRARQEDAVKPDWPHQERRVAERQRSVFSNGDDANGGAIGSCCAGKPTRSCRRTTRSHRRAAGETATSALLVVLKPHLTRRS